MGRVVCREPDARQNTGLGIWTEDMFLDALKTGKHMGKGRQILPPMPWNWYGQLPTRT